MRARELVSSIAVGLLTLGLFLLFVEFWWSGLYAILIALLLQAGSGIQQ